MTDFEKDIEHTQECLASSGAHCSCPKKEPSEKIKCYEITPAGHGQFDILIIEAGDTWNPALDFVEKSLEGQFLDDKEWDEISVKVKCVYKTRQQLNELERE